MFRIRIAAIAALILIGAVIVVEVAGNDTGETASDAMSASGSGRGKYPLNIP